jgi:hypothetical protein
MEDDDVWNEKWTSNILESYYQNFQIIYGQFYEENSR